MTLLDLLHSQHADPDDATSPMLLVSQGVLSEEKEKAVLSASYRGLPYCYVLNLGDAEVVRYDNGRSRYLTPIDVVFEARSDTQIANVNKLWDWLFEAVLDVDELRPGHKLATPFRRIGGYRAESKRKGFWEALLRLETSWR